MVKIQLLAVLLRLQLGGTPLVGADLYSISLERINRAIVSHFKDQVVHVVSLILPRARALGRETLTFTHPSDDRGSVRHPIAGTDLAHTLAIGQPLADRVGQFIGVLRGPAHSAAH